MPTVRPLHFELGKPIVKDRDDPIILIQEIKVKSQMFHLGRYPVLMGNLCTQNKKRAIKRAEEPTFKLREGTTLEFL